MRVDEARIAEQIISVLPAGVAREFSSEREMIRYAVRGEGMRLRSIVFNRESLRRLACDPQAPVKIEYLQRDLARSATQRREFRYPRPHLLPARAARKPLAFGLPMASMF